MNIEQVRAILADIQIFDRTFKLTPFADHAGDEVVHGWHLQVCYFEPDIETGKVELQESRQWPITDTMDETAIVDTVFAAVMRSYDHVVKEHFTYKGERVFSPHFTIKQRLSMARFAKETKEIDESANALVFFSELLNSSFYDVVDMELDRFDVDAVHYATILSVLSITWHGKQHLQRRDAFLARCEVRLSKELGERRTQLLLKTRR